MLIQLQSIQFSIYLTLKNSFLHPTNPHNYRPFITQHSKFHHLLPNKPYRKLILFSLQPNIATLYQIGQQFDNWLHYFYVDLFLFCLFQELDNGGVGF